MTRTILTPAAFPAAALTDVKQWLAITGSGEDDALTSLVKAAIELCESFTGQMLLESECEEPLPACRGIWQVLATRPVQAITQLEGVPAEGARFTLTADAYAIDLEADGGAKIRLLRQGSAGRIAVRFTAGMAGDWADLPESLRHGVIRLAAHLFRQRVEENTAGAPPAAVTALWRPWRRYHLA